MSILSPNEIGAAAVVKYSWIHKLGRINFLFAITVFAPTLLSIIYFGFIASDVYISEARFAVRSPDRQVAPGLGALLKGAGFSRSQDDTYMVHDFMHSRDALGGVDAKLDVRTMFGGQHVDLLSRFNGIGMDGSKEALFRYYQAHVALDLDTASSISTLRVSAFTADDAYRINTLLLEMGERLINQLNERGRQDMVRFARIEVAAAEKAARAAGAALAAFRDQQNVFDPERQSALQLHGIAKLQEELFATTAQLEQVRSVAPQNPQVPVLQRRTAAVRAEIDAQMAKVAGGSASLTGKTAQFERLTLDRVIADKQLGAAVASLEMARNEAQRKQLYLERIVRPNKPDSAVEPRRIRAILAAFLLGLVCWGILTLLVASVREHRN